MKRYDITGMGGEVAAAEVGGVRAPRLAVSLDQVFVRVLRQFPE